MSINAAALRLMREKGLSLDDVVEIAAAMEARRDPTGAERAQRCRDKKRGIVTRDVTRDAPNDIYSKPLADPVEAEASTSPFEIRLVEEWNAKAAKAGARRSVKLDASRKTLLRARRRDFSEDELLQAVANIAASPFHCGKNDRGWRAGLGWVLKAENFTKALELGDGAAVPDTPRVADHAAYLASLESKPWANGSARPDPPPRPPGQTRGPAPIGALIPNLASQGHH